MATDLTVFSPGVTAAGLRKLANAWTLETGNRVNIISGTIGVIKNNVMSDMPGDVVLLPPLEMKDISGKVKAGTNVPVGRALFGLIAKTGADHPDVSTVRKFGSALRAAGSIGYNDPATQSLSGQMVESMLKRGEFKKARPKASRVARCPPAGGARSEQLGNPAVDLVGTFPTSLNMHIDFSAAVLAGTMANDVAASFVHYVARAEAASSRQA